MDFSYTILIPLIPLAVFLLLGINYKSIKPALSGWIGSLGLFITLVLSYYTAYQYFFVVGWIWFSIVHIFHGCNEPVGII